jgi:hypothetical protein
MKKEIIKGFERIKIKNDLAEHKELINRIIK